MQFKLKQFNGPFDLLLSLVEGKELKITEIALSEITEQYLKYLDTLEETDVYELADFLVVAARLLHMKSRLLLPEFLFDEEDEGGLEVQLKLYKQFVDASKIIEAKWMDGAQSFFRVETPRQALEFSLPTNVLLESLTESMIQLVSKLIPAKTLERTYIDKTVSLKERVDSIIALLKSRKSFKFFDVLDDANNKTEVIIGFLAILELAKRKSLIFKQDMSFGDILITRV